jgi:hypothetical protein
LGRSGPQPVKITIFEFPDFQRNVELWKFVEKSEKCQTNFFELKKYEICAQYDFVPYFL